MPISQNCLLRSQCVIFVILIFFNKLIGFAEDNTATSNIVECIVPFILHLRELCAFHILGATGWNFERDDRLINQKINKIKYVVTLTYS